MVKFGRLWQNLILPQNCDIIYVEKIKRSVFMGYIYKITNNINGKVYIGKTDFTVESRWKNHLHD